MAIKIIDLSSNNGIVDFAKVKNAGVESVIMRSSMGYGCKDKMLVNNAKSANAAGLKVSYYHFAYPDKKINASVTGDAQAEANYFADTVLALPKFEFLIIDLERFDAVSDTPLSKNEYYQWVSTFIAQVDKRTGYKCLIYSSSYYLNDRLPNNHDLGVQCKLWVANYNKVKTPPVPVGWSGWFMWQYSDAGKVDGVKTNVDCSILSNSQ